MAEFKDGISIIYQLFCVNFANREKLHIFAESLGIRRRDDNPYRNAITSLETVSRGRTM